ncbi:MAG TPA: hypothetical protein VNA13_04645 [Xanthomonadales bacterium]|nr:hypothetical protein [Xanthomonadales bacterium]
MTRRKIILICGLILIALVMLFVILVPFKKNNFLTNKTSPTSTPVPTYVDKSLGGTVVAQTESSFKDIANSKVTGRTTFKEVDGNVFVTVVLTNVSKDAEYPAYIHKGTCREEGDIKYSLSPVVDGKTENYISGTLEQFKKDFPLSVKIHKPAYERDGFVTCADLK